MNHHPSMEERIMSAKKTMAMLACGLWTLSALAGCSEEPQGYLPPDLGAGGRNLVIDDSPLAGGEERTGSYAGEGNLLGFVFQARAGESYDITLNRLSGDAVPAVAIYQRTQGEWSAPLAWASADAARISIGGWEVPSTGTFLVLVDVAAGGPTGTFGLMIQCTAGCGNPLICSADADCPAGQVCFAGLCLEDGVECRTNADCRAGETCERGFCVEVCVPAVEVCDGVDNDCDGLIDEGCSFPCTTNADCAAGQVCMDGVCVEDNPDCRTDADCPAGQVCVAGLCQPACACASDADCPAGHACRDCACWPVCLPSMEICDGLDNDCDGLVDEGCGTPCRTDLECALGQVCTNGVCVAQSLPCSSDIDCPPGEVCVTGLCQPSCTDMDGDGYCAFEDCDDQNPSIHPAAFEACDGLDNDCDGQVDEGCSMTCASNADCAAGEVCIDGVCIPAGPQCSQDLDCPAGQVCIAGTCQPACTDFDGDGFCAGEDCDDRDASVNPAASELCDGRDNDCDGLVDEGCGQACTADADCAAGQVCWQGVCVLGCRTDADCPAGQACLAGICQAP
jgi:Cys-rich repeat protein